MVDINIQQQDLNLSQMFEGALTTTFNFIPNLIGALIILLLGWIAGRILGSIVGNIAHKTGLDRSVRTTPLGRLYGGTEHNVANIFNILTRLLVYGVAFIAAANVLAIPALSQWLALAITYLPAFIAGILIIILGFVLADFIGDMIERTGATGRKKHMYWFADFTRIFLYFIVIVIGLDTMGVDVTILYILAVAAAGGLALGIAIAIGIGFGWGTKDYIDNHINEWTRKARDETENSRR